MGIERKAKDTLPPSASATTKPVLMLLCRQWPIQHVPSYTTIHGLAEVEQEDDLTKLLEITCGYFEKLEDGNPKRIGPWQLLCWQPRWCQAERDGFCHQPVSTTEVTAHKVASRRSPQRRTGKPCKIPYGSIEAIHIVESASGLRTELVIECREAGSYRFKAPTEAACASLAANLRKLVEISNQ